MWRREHDRKRSAVAPVAMAAGGSEARYRLAQGQAWPFLMDRAMPERVRGPHVRVKPWGYGPLDPEASAVIFALGPQPLRERQDGGAILPIPAVQTRGARQARILGLESRSLGAASCLNRGNAALTRLTVFRFRVQAVPQRNGQFQATLFHGGPGTPSHVLHVKGAPIRHGQVVRARVAQLQYELVQGELPLGWG